MDDFDIIIVGAGIVGAVAALALAKQTPLRIALIDTNKLSSDWLHSKYEARVSAISLASQKIFQNLGVWQAIQEKRISPYQKIYVWDANSSGKVYFDCESLHSPVLGFIVEDNVMRSSLFAAIEKQNNIEVLAPLQLIDFQQKHSYVEICAENDKYLRTKLLIAADGANSWVREKAGVSFKTRSYQHQAIVATVRTTKFHEHTARQKFLTTGPLAFLPLADESLCSIVWSVIPDYAEELLGLSDEDFCRRLALAFDYQLGDITEVDKRYSFALQMRHAKTYLQPNIVLVGDAAHTVHPLAGQGLNLGLLDAVCLSEVISDAFKKQRNFSSQMTLRRYERWRKGNNIAMLTFVEGIKHLFASESNTLQNLRGLGLNAANRLEVVKKFFMTQAAGKFSDLPRLAYMGK